MTSCRADPGTRLEYRRSEGITTLNPDNFSKRLLAAAWARRLRLYWIPAPHTPNPTPVLGVAGSGGNSITGSDTLS